MHHPLMVEVTCACLWACISSSIAITVTIIINMVLPFHHKNLVVLTRCALVQQFVPCTHIAHYGLGNADEVVPCL